MFLTVLRNALRDKTYYFLEYLVQKPQRNVATALQHSKRMANTVFDTTQPNEKGANISKTTIIKEKHKKNITTNTPGTVTLQILGTGSNGAPASVYLFTDHSRYLFNCGEGTQRLAHEHKAKITRLEQIFLTRNTWPAIGGFPGLALTIQDAGVKELALHGPPFLDNILFSMKRFVVLKHLQLNTVDCTKIKDFEDSVMSVKSVPLYRDSETTKKDKTFIVNASTEEQISIAYICKLKPKPGALNLEKCVNYGVTPGPLLGLLKNGFDVTLDNGTMVKSKDVSDSNENSLSFMFLDIPSIEFLENLKKHEKILVNSKINIDDTPEMSLVVHFSPQEVVNNNLYKKFVGKFPAATHHIYINCKQNTFSGYIAAHRIQYQLNLLNSKVFPLLKEDSNLCNKQKKSKFEDDYVDGKHKTNLADITNNSEDKKSLTDLKAMSFYHLRPRKGLDRSNEVKLAPSEYIKETEALQDFPLLLEKLKDNLKQETSSNLTIQYPLITFLGTGSCVPNKTRNVSSILVQQQKDSYVLLDCGEGTLGQIQRFFGCKKAEEVVKNLKCIYISHLHADHHIGLIGLLTERLKLLGNNEDIKKILLLAPKQIAPWLDFYHDRILKIKNSYELIGNAEMLDTPLSLKLTYKDCGLESIKTCLVKHCPHSFGVSLKLTETNKENKHIKITYSGDTMPCQDLIDLGLNSDVLIHEATMEDDLIEEAKIKTHSTISQAIKQGQLMNAQYTILTHFSQRYAKLPRLQSNSACSPINTSNDSLDDQKDESLISDIKRMENVSIAFDNMQVDLKDLEQFHFMYPALRSLFAEHAEELEQKALKREINLERKRKFAT